MQSCEELIKRRNTLRANIATLEARIKQSDLEEAELREALVQGGYDPDNLLKEMMEMQGKRDALSSKLDAEIAELEEYVRAALEALA